MSCPKPLSARDQERDCAHEWTIIPAGSTRKVSELAHEASSVEKPCGRGSDTECNFSSTSMRRFDLVAEHCRTLKRAGVRPSDSWQIELGEWLMLGVPNHGTRRVTA